MQSLLRVATRERRPRMVPLVTTLTAAVAVVASRKLLGVPGPLAVTLLSCLLAWLVAHSLLGIPRQATRAREAAGILLPWASLSFALLGAVYGIDRAGWLWFRISGVNTAMAEHRGAEVELSPAEFVRRNPAFALDPADSSRLILRRGIYTFCRTVIVPRGTGLTIDAGTTVRFGAGCSLVSYSPIVARGEPESPIQFLPRHSWFKWGVVGLVDAGRSVLERVHFEHARQARVNEIDFPGGLSLIRTDGEVRDCRFRHLYGKDAVYVCRGRVTVMNNIIDRAFKDGIDSDGARGAIRGNVVIGCEDEGIDLSDHEFLDVHGNTIRDWRGGRISATSDLERIRAQNTLELLTDG